MFHRWAWGGCLLPNGVRTSTPDGWRESPHGRNHTAQLPEEDVRNDYQVRAIAVSGNFMYACKRSNFGWTFFIFCFSQAYFRFSITGRAWTQWWGMARPSPRGLRKQSQTTISSPSCQSSKWVNTSSTQQRAEVFWTTLFKSGVVIILGYQTLTQPPAVHWPYSGRVWCSPPVKVQGNGGLFRLRRSHGLGRVRRQHPERRYN